MPPAASVVGIGPTAPTEPYALSQLKNETILAPIVSPSDKHQRHGRRYSTNVSRIHTAIRQKSAAYTPLFNKCQRHTHRYLTNVIFDKIQRYTHRYSTNVSGIHPAIRQGRRAQLYTYNACLRTHFRCTYPQQICVNSHHNTPASIQVKNAPV